jgi:hypothetical protein
VEGMRNAAAIHAPDMIIRQIPLDEGENAIKTAIASLKDTGFNFVFAVVFTPEIHDGLMNEAFAEGVAGDGHHTWLFGDSFLGTLDGRTFPKDGPLHLSYRGSGLFEVTGGVTGMPKYDKYISTVAELRNPTDLEYLGSLYPTRENAPEYGDDPPFIDDETYLQEITSVFSPFFYEATISLGLSACEASQETPTFSGLRHFEYFKNLTFTGFSGAMAFDPATGTRDPASALYKVTNYVDQVEVDPETGGRWFGSCQSTQTSFWKVVGHRQMITCSMMVPTIFLRMF